ncbi:MAG: 16S rRNA (cytidine(1402)-2'-O)-methyltransferase [bacterium]|jgi:16S rRNA (cytidine1402-2'-O)-methyltransferase
MTETESKKAGTLYLVPTPIGNLGDITSRALEIIKAVELIACEDTRVTGKLLSLYGIKKRMLSYHNFNEQARLPQLLSVLTAGGDVAIISDAGSPGLSDPAYRIIRAAIDNGIKISPLPGANSVIPALTASGLPLDRFFFEGFLPQKSAARKNRLAKLRELDHTLIFFESPFRIEKTVADLLEVLGDRPACLAREISKMYEEFIRGKLSEILAQVSQRRLKGEFVIVVAGHLRKELS